MAQKQILNKYSKSKNLYIFSRIFYKLNFVNFNLILNVLKKKYNYIFIDPNINIFKAIIFSLFIRADKKIYKKFLFHTLFFNESSYYNQNLRKKYYINLNKKINRNNNFLKLKLNTPRKKILGIAPGTGKLENHRRWDHNNFINIINSLKSKFDLVYIFGNEKKLIFDISTKIKIKYKIISYKDINKSLEKIKDLNTLITNDNGIANFAANYGVKCNIICGPSIPESIKNLKNVNIISNNLNCSPCYSKNRYGCGNPICLTQFTAKKVLKKIN